MNESHSPKSMVDLDVSFPVWERVFTVAPLVVIGTREGCPTPGLDSLPTESAQHVEGRVLKGALLVLECELTKVVDGIGSASLLIGKVVAARAPAGALRTTGVDDEEVIRHAPLLAYLSPGRWAEVGESHNFPFPADFKR